MKLSKLCIPRPRGNYSDSYGGNCLHLFPVVLFALANLFLFGRAIPASAAPEVARGWNDCEIAGADEPEKNPRGYDLFMARLFNGLVREGVIAASPVTLCNVWARDNLVLLQTGIEKFFGSSGGFVHNERVYRASEAFLVEPVVVDGVAREFRYRLPDNATGFASVSQGVVGCAVEPLKPLLPDATANERAAHELAVMGNIQCLFGTRRRVEILSPRTGTQPDADNAPVDNHAVTSNPGTPVTFTDTFGSEAIPDHPPLSADDVVRDYGQGLEENGIIAHFAFDNDSHTVELRSDDTRSQIAFALASELANPYESPEVEAGVIRSNLTADVQRGFVSPDITAGGKHAVVARVPLVTALGAAISLSVAATDDMRRREVQAVITTPIRVQASQPPPQSPPPQCNEPRFITDTADHYNFNLRGRVQPLARQEVAIFSIIPRSAAAGYSLLGDNFGPLDGSDLRIFGLPTVIDPESIFGSLLHPDFSGSHKACNWRNAHTVAFDGPRSANGFTRLACHQRVRFGSLECCDAISRLANAMGLPGAEQMRCVTAAGESDYPTTDLSGLILAEPTGETDCNFSGWSYYSAQQQAKVDIGTEVKGFRFTAGVGGAWTDVRTDQLGVNRCMLTFDVVGATSSEFRHNLPKKAVVIMQKSRVAAPNGGADGGSSERGSMDRAVDVITYDRERFQAGVHPTNVPNSGSVIGCDLLNLKNDLTGSSKCLFTPGGPNAREDSCRWLAYTPDDVMLRAPRTIEDSFAARGYVPITFPGNSWNCSDWPGIFNATGHKAYRTLSLRAGDPNMTIEINPIINPAEFDPSEQTLRLRFSSPVADIASNLVNIEGRPAPYRSFDFGLFPYVETDTVSASSGLFTEASYHFPRNQYRFHTPATWGVDDELARKWSLQSKNEWPYYARIRMLADNIFFSSTSPQQPYAVVPVASNMHSGEYPALKRWVLPGPLTPGNPLQCTVPPAEFYKPENNTNWVGSEYLLPINPYTTCCKPIMVVDNESSEGYEQQGCGCVPDLAPADCRSGICCSLPIGPLKPGQRRSCDAVESSTEQACLARHGHWISVQGQFNLNSVCGPTIDTPWYTPPRRCPKGDRDPVFTRVSYYREVPLDYYASDPPLACSGYIFRQRCPRQHPTDPGGEGWTGTDPEPDPGGGGEPGTDPIPPGGGGGSGGGGDVGGGGGVVVR